MAPSGAPFDEGRLVSGPAPFFLARHGKNVWEKSVRVRVGKP
ncbi:hypothetical protein HMPREF9440_01614 [Sutterella parvirubra YIT 11816]|uniref:Uncharacterized protein n=1 Tax=Sutterella parvirubra YIT 11816 TaxID=762967 RepID=H3KFU5_9BURK|nr:hypothetical protein HMPREF9440_01614 [Sutterella parvirubra YIT 11816]